VLLKSRFSPECPPCTAARDTAKEESNVTGRRVD
jgi:hypothetical protein